MNSEGPNSAVICSFFFTLLALDRTRMLFQRGMHQTSTSLQHILLQGYLSEKRKSQLIKGYRYRGLDHLSCNLPEMSCKGILEREIETSIMLLSAVYLKSLLRHHILFLLSILYVARRYVCSTNGRLGMPWGWWIYLVHGTPNRGTRKGWEPKQAFSEHPPEDKNRKPRNRALLLREKLDQGRQRKA